MPGSKDPLIRWITSPVEIRSLRKSGSLDRGDLVFVWSSGRGGPADEASVAVVTGRGFSGAVARNLAKRRLRGSVLQLRGLLEPGRSYLIEARKELERANYQILVFEIEQKLMRARNWERKKKATSCRS